METVIERRELPLPFFVLTDINGVPMVGTVDDLDCAFVYSTQALAETYLAAAEATDLARILVISDAATACDLLEMLFRKSVGHLVWDGRIEDSVAHLSRVEDDLDALRAAGHGLHSEE